MLLPRSSAAISPTGHYTGYTWLRAGLSDPALATTTGRVLYDSLRLPQWAASRVGLPTLDGLLLGRHAIIDTLLDEAVASGRIGQVIELAAGLSPRGLTFSRRYPELTYVEADLPGMAATKCRLLREAGALNERHHVVETDAFADIGPTSLAALAEPLDHDRGLAVITEGLLNYFPVGDVLGLWSRIANVQKDFPSGLYLADLVIKAHRAAPLLDIGATALGLFVRGHIQADFEPGQLPTDLEEAGFTSVAVHRVDRHPASADWHKDPSTRLVRVIEAS